jgi:hypothetical protein
MRLMLAAGKPNERQPSHQLTLAKRQALQPLDRAIWQGKLDFVAKATRETMVSQRKNQLGQPPPLGTRPSHFRRPFAAITEQSTADSGTAMLISLGADLGGWHEAVGSRIGSSRGIVLHCRHLAVCIFLAFL